MDFLAWNFLQVNPLLQHSHPIGNVALSAMIEILVDSTGRDCHVLQNDAGREASAPCREKSSSLTLS